MTRAFAVMVESAMLITITIAVAAERPPRKAMSVSQLAPSAIGSVRTIASAWCTPASPWAAPLNTIGTTSTENNPRYSGNSQRAVPTSLESAHSTTLT